MSSVGTHVIDKSAARSFSMSIFTTTTTNAPSAICLLSLLYHQFRSNDGNSLYRTVSSGKKKNCHRAHVYKYIYNQINLGEIAKGKAFLCYVPAQSYIEVLVIMK